MTEQTNHERLQDEVIPKQEISQVSVSPVIATKMATDRVRDVEAQRRGEISSLYDVGEAPVPEGGVSAPSPLEGAPQTRPIESPERTNQSLLDQVGKRLEPGRYEYEGGLKPGERSIASLRGDK